MIYANFTDYLFGYNSQTMRGNLDRLVSALAAAGITQSELARRLGVTRAAVNNWIKGRTTPQLGHLIEIARILDMTLSEILGDEVIFAESKTERDIITALRDMSESDRDQLSRMAQLLASDTSKDG